MEVLTTPPPAVRLRRKSSQHRVESAETLRFAESQETLATDPALERATTCEQALACGTPTPAPATDKPKTTRKNRLRKMKTRDVEPEQSPVNEKALLLYPAERSPAKRPIAKANAKAKASQVLKRPAMANTRPGSSTVTGDQKSGGGSGVSTPKVRAKKAAKAKPKPASRKRKQPDEDEHGEQEEQEEEQEKERSGEEDQGETAEDKISAKAKRAHKLYMRYWRNLRSQDLNISAPSYKSYVSAFVCIRPEHAERNQRFVETLQVLSGPH